MGMAASQARFLGLTARKSNVEYQAQQINQQRTALANESANLYNQMMTLDVPTPPSSSDFKKTVYTLDDSATGNNSNYTIVNMNKTYGDYDNEYSIVLSYKESQKKPLETIYKPTAEPNKTTHGENNEHTTYTIHLGEVNNDKKAVNLTYNTADTNAYTEQGILKNSKNQIYALPEDEEQRKTLDGYSTATEEYRSDSKSTEANFDYFYIDENGINHFLTSDDLEVMKGEKEAQELNIYSTYTYNKEATTTVIGTIEESKNGRPSSVIIKENDKYPSNLSGKEFSITTSQVQDDDAYNDAMNDYEYEKELYEKSISDINAKTAIIQKQDQQLELRIDQLDTEQNAIKTEMDSVTKVIEDNVEKTFNIFG